MADMETLGYHRKYRPMSLSQYVGMQNVKETVMKMLDSGKRVQTIMLYGDSGCGKTTLARIIAKEYNCSSRTDGRGACGICPSCQGIDEYIISGDTGMLGSVKEVDIGDNSGKNDLEGVLSDIELPAMGDEWKIYIFDEIQSASTALQNRLLKVTEEPPENVLFMFCTTNPERLLPTLKNRCQLKLHITKPSVKDLSTLLRRVCSSEGVQYDDKGLELIANRSELTIRTALQNLNQVVMEQSSATYDSVTKVFEEVSSNYMIKFFSTLKTRDIFGFVTCMCEVKSKMELNLFLQELRAFLTRGIYVINGLTVEGVSKEEMPVYRDLFSSMSVDELGILMHKLLNIDRNNIELDLLTLGYVGLVQEKQVTEEDVIPTIEGECKLEEANAEKVIKEKETVERKQGVANAEKLVQSLSLEDILGMGGTLVE